MAPEPPATPPAAQDDDEDLLDPTPIIVRPYVLIAEQERAAQGAADEAAWRERQANINAQLAEERARRSERLSQVRRRISLAYAAHGQDWPEPLRGPAALA